MRKIESTTCECMEMRYIHPTSGSCVIVAYCSIDEKRCYRQCEESDDEAD